MVTVTSNETLTGPLQTGDATDEVMLSAEKIRHDLYTWRYPDTSPCLSRVLDSVHGHHKVVYCLERRSRVSVSLCPPSHRPYLFVHRAPVDRLYPHDHVLHAENNHRLARGVWYVP